MAVKIESLGIEVPGRVTRKHDEDSDVTTLTVGEVQARSLYESLGSVLAFFDAQGPSNAEVAKKLSTPPTVVPPQGAAAS